MNIFKRRSPELIIATLLITVVVACQGETPPLANPPNLSSSPTLTSTPTLRATPSPTEPIVIQTPLRDAPIEEQAREALANLLGISKEEIEVIKVAEVEWPDTSLGCPEPGRAYLQVIVPGCRVVMRVGDEVYEYHSGGGHGVLCDGEGNSLICTPCQYDRPNF